MSLLDTILGKPPEHYDPEDDALAKVDPIETKSAPFAARRNAERYTKAMTTVSVVAQEVSGTRRLLLIIIALLIANKAIDIGVIAGLLGQ